MIAKCTHDIHFKLHMYVIETYSISNDKPCVDGIYVQSKMNILDTFGSHGIGGRDSVFPHTRELCRSF